jgi:N-glycosylase/DNA lyase
MYKMLKELDLSTKSRCTVIGGLGKYSLRDTLECGQCFRFERIDAPESDGEIYIVTTPYGVVKVGQKIPGELIFYDTDGEIGEEIKDFFALDRPLSDIKDDVIAHTNSTWLREAAEFGEGIAILRQDPFETLISFIISQNNNIPRIKKIIKMIAAEYGVNLTLQNGADAKCPLNLVSGTPCEEKCKSCGVCYSFPKPIDIVANPEKLLPSHPGFRYKYIVDAAEKVASGEINLDMIAAARSYFHTLECLKQIKGVGDKVASCVALFAFSNLEAFPIDVWMKRAIDTYFDGSLDPTTLGRYAGVAQQYIFHYIRNIENG